MAKGFRIDESLHIFVRTEAALVNSWSLLDERVMVYTWLRASVSMKASIYLSGLRLP